MNATKVSIDFHGIIMFLSVMFNHQSTHARSHTHTHTHLLQATALKEGNGKLEGSLARKKRFAQFCSSNFHSKLLSN